MCSERDKRIKRPIMGQRKKGQQYASGKPVTLRQSHTIGKSVTAKTQTGSPILCLLLGRTFFQGLRSGQ